MKKVGLYKFKVVMKDYRGWEATFVGVPTKDDLLAAHSSDASCIELNSPDGMMHQFIDLYWLSDREKSPVCHHLGIEVGRLHLSEEGVGWIQD